MQIVNATCKVKSQPLRSGPRRTSTSWSSKFLVSGQRIPDHWSPSTNTMTKTKISATTKMARMRGQSSKTAPRLTKNSICVFLYTVLRQRLTHFNSARNLKNASIFGVSIFPKFLSKNWHLWILGTFYKKFSTKFGNETILKVEIGGHTCPWFARVMSVYAISETVMSNLP